MKKNTLAITITLMSLVAGCSAVAQQPAAGARNNPDFSAVTQAIDLNKDGKMTRLEWAIARAPMSSFNMFEKDRGFVTLADFEDNAAPAGIDLNGDGALTLEEFKTFDRNMSAQMPPEKRPVIRAAERALAMWEVQNVMSKHAYLHAVAINSEEIDTLWVSAEGEYAGSATFASPAWKMNGIKTIKAAYGEQNQRNREKALAAISKLNPKIENVPENLGAGHEWAMHTNTTPVIEIAGDGKTAKGIWYSPGMGLMTDIKDKTVAVRGTFFWEKYGGDFILENGRWKIWHLQMAYDFTPSLDGDWLDFGKKGMAEAGEREGEMEMPEGFSAPDFSYPSYSPERTSIIYPPIPAPYYSFSETFSY